MLGRKKAAGWWTRRQKLSEVIMLKLAFSYKEKLNQPWQSVIFNEKYQFYNYGNSWNYKIELSENSNDSMEMVSVDAEDNVIGYIAAAIDRYTNKISNICAINFEEVNFTFAKDFYQFLSDLFTKYKFRKIEWRVIIGNPAEKLYDKIIGKYGGRIVGVRYQSTITTDGILRDEKEYEIFKSDYDAHTAITPGGDI
jgi:hypothetical protein